MEDSFDIPITYKGESLLFAARLIQLGYVHKFQVDVNGQDVYFEQDDEGNYRAIIDYTKLSDTIKIDAELLKVIANGIEETLK